MNPKFQIIYYFRQLNTIIQQTTFFKLKQISKRQKLDKRQKNTASIQSHKFRTKIQVKCRNPTHFQEQPLSEQRTYDSSSRATCCNEMLIKCKCIMDFQLRLFPTSHLTEHQPPNNQPTNRPTTTRYATILTTASIHGSTTCCVFNVVRSNKLLL